MAAIDFSRLWGNDAVRAMLSAKIAHNTAAHAYLIAGAMGAGKKTLAFLIAAAMCCEDAGTRPCFRCPSCRKLLSGNSPDLMTLGIESLPLKPAGAGADPVPDAEVPRSIGVDAIRALQADVYIKPNDLMHKIYIIGHADRMTVQAQNALLKILEEPPLSVVFLLLCENPAALLPTIRSRVQTLKLEPFDDATLCRLLLEHNSRAKTLAAKDPEQFRLFVRLSGGTVGGVQKYLQADAKTLAADPVYEAHETASRCLACIFSSDAAQTSPALMGGGAPVLPRKTALYEIIASRAPTREQLRALLDALMTALRDLLLFAYAEEEGDAVDPLYFADAAQPRALTQTVSPASVSAAAAGLGRLRASLDSNPNTQLVFARLTDILFGMRF